MSFSRRFLKIDAIAALRLGKRCRNLPASRHDMRIVHAERRRSHLREPEIPKRELVARGRGLPALSPNGPPPRPGSTLCTPDAGESMTRLHRIDSYRRIFLEGLGNAAATALEAHALLEDELAAEHPARPTAMSDTAAAR